VQTQLDKKLDEIGTKNNRERIAPEVQIIVALERQHRPARTIPTP
jgi:hypothetical protein